MSSEEFSQDVNDVERALRSLRPASPPLDRDRLMFLAGQAAAPPARTVNRLRTKTEMFWPSAAAAMTLVSLGLGMTLALRPPTVIERAVLVPAAQRPEENAPRQPQPVRLESSDSVADAGPLKSEAVAAVSTRSGDRYLRLRDQAIAHGIDFVDSLSPVTRTSNGPEESDSRQELLDQMLHRRKAAETPAPNPLLNLLLNLGEET